MIRELISGALIVGGSRIMPAIIRLGEYLDFFVLGGIFTNIHFAFGESFLNNINMKKLA